MSATRLLLARVEVPPVIGTVIIASDGRHLVGLDYGGPEQRLRRQLRQQFGPDIVFEETGDPQGFASAVRAYFAGELTAFDGLPLRTGGSPFQRLVWAALREIPVGETRSYGFIAARIGRPTASRAVGLANSLNPINLAVPCHRVIGASGALTGYGGGVARKQWLLAHERAGRHVRYIDDKCAPLQKPT